MSWLFPWCRPACGVVARFYNVPHCTRMPMPAPAVGRPWGRQGLPASIYRWSCRRGMASDAGDDPATVKQAACWHAEATVAAKAGQLREASVLYEKAMRARIELLGEFDPETDRTRHSLAATLEVCQSSTERCRASFPHRALTCGTVASWWIARRRFTTCRVPTGRSSLHYETNSAGL